MKYSHDLIEYSTFTTTRTIIHIYFLHGSFRKYFNASPVYLLAFTRAHLFWRVQTFFRLFIYVKTTRPLDGFNKFKVFFCARYILRSVSCVLSFRKWDCLHFVFSVSEFWIFKHQTIQNRNMLSDGEIFTVCL